jgi:putative hydrolase of the HAD superfamily
MAIKWIFFDFDGVITLDKSGSFTTCTYLTKFIPDKTFDEILSTYRLWHQDMLVGTVSHKKIWKDFCLKLGVNLDYEILEQAFLSTPINKQIIDLTKSLKDSYNLGIITDNSSERMSPIIEYNNLGNIFDLIVVSGDVGSKKNNKDIFETVLRKSNVEPSECVFIDNSKNNLIIPDKLGLKTIFYDHDTKDVGTLGSDLNELLK